MDTGGVTQHPVAPQHLHLAILVRPVIAGGDAGYLLRHLLHQRHFSGGDLLEALADLFQFWLFFNRVVALCYRAAIFALLRSSAARTTKSGWRASTLRSTPPLRSRV